MTTTPIATATRIGHVEELPDDCEASGLLCPDDCGGTDPPLSTGIACTLPWNASIVRCGARSQTFRFTTAPEPRFCNGIMTHALCPSVT